jgi:hypothetical protein
MWKVYLPSLLTGAGFVFWAHTHTDELPITLGFALIAGVILTALFPEHWAVTLLIVGAAIPTAETLVHFNVTRAPYAAGSALPWAALFAYVPTFLGVGIGAGLRRIVSQ